MDTISGGVMPNGGSIKMTINSNKLGYVITPNGQLLTTVAGVINSTYTGEGGNLLYLFQNTSTPIVLLNSGLSGKIIYSGNKQLNIDGSIGITSLVCGTGIMYVSANGCSINANSIADILYDAYANSALECYFDFSGGGNAIESAINASLIANHGGVTYSDIYSSLVGVNAGTILIDAV